MQYVLVKDGDRVISKDAYVGDQDRINAIVAEKQEANKQLTYQFVDEQAFNATPIEDPKKKEKDDWMAAKSRGTVDALAFLAKKMGLE